MPPIIYNYKKIKTPLKRRR